MRNHGNVFPKAVHLNMTDVLAIDKDASLFDIVEPEKELEECGFSPSCLPYQCDCLAGCSSEGDSLRHFTLAVVGERNVLELDSTLQEEERAGI